VVCWIVSRSGSGFLKYPSLRTPCESINTVPPRDDFIATRTFSKTASKR
jgi:hypothetical protein